MHLPFWDSCHVSIEHQSPLSANNPELWRPTENQIRSSQLQAFMDYLADQGLVFQDYQALYDWSIRDLDSFWQAVVNFCQVEYSQGWDQVLRLSPKMRESRWFEGAQLNMAQNLLRYHDEREALVFYVEGQCRQRLSYQELHQQVSLYQQALIKKGVRKGDRVCALMPNMPQTIIAMLATLSMGAAWSSCSPDFGFQGVLDRFGQIEPRIMFCADHYQYKGKAIDCRPLVSQLADAIPGLETIVIIPFEKTKLDLRDSGSGPSDFKESSGNAFQSRIVDPLNQNRSKPKPLFVSESSFVATGNPSLPVEFTPLPFDHPVYIMFSSGTTGLPKCLVQGAGVLINHIKEHVLHGDLKKEQTIFYFTTCGWMMWNWLASSLFTGARVVLYDGSPFHPGPEVLWQMVAAEGIHIFGTSPKYLTALQGSGLDLGQFDLTELKVMLSTGAPLGAEQFEYVYQHIKSDLRLSSISGGTDLNGCFALGNPVLPVYAGELQSRGLGMAVKVLQADEQISETGTGELVCTAPFPSMPLWFLNDSTGERYQDAYFAGYDGVWHHGDYIVIHPHGGVEVLGRSDATLNPGGVRIGTAEIYNALEELKFISDAIAVGQPWQNDERIVLFVVLNNGLELSAELVKQIQDHIRASLTARHVPARVLQVSAVPYTRNGKKVELAVKKAILGQAIKNSSAIQNPELLDEYRQHPGLLQ